jgi:hypothetical protein
MAMYSASVKDFETVDCFLEVQDIRLELKNMTKSIVERLSSEQHA